MGEVEADSLDLAAFLPLALRHDEDRLVAAEERLEEAVIGFFCAPEGSDVLEGALEGGGHLAEERAAVLDLQHAYLFQFLLVGYLQARPGQFPVVEIGQGVEQRLEIVSLPLLLQLMGAHTRVSRSAHEAAHALPPAPARLGEAVVDKIQLAALPHQVLRLEVAVHHSLGVHAFHNRQQLQGHLADVALRVLLQLAQVALQQLHLQKQPAFPLLAGMQFRHSLQALQFTHDIRLVPQDRLEAGTPAVLDLYGHKPFGFPVEGPDNSPKAALAHDLKQLVLAKGQILL